MRNGILGGLIVVFVFVWAVSAGQITRVEVRYGWSQSHLRQQPTLENNSTRIIVQTTGNVASLERRLMRIMTEWERQQQRLGSDAARDETRIEVDMIHHCPAGIRSTLLDRLHQRQLRWSSTPLLTKKASVRLVHTLHDNNDDNEEAGSEHAVLPLVVAALSRSGQRRPQTHFVSFDAHCRESGSSSSYCLGSWEQTDEVLQWRQTAAAASATTNAAGGFSEVHLHHAAHPDVKSSDGFLASLQKVLLPSLPTVSNVGVPASTQPQVLVFNVDGVDLNQLVYGLSAFCTSCRRARWLFVVPRFISSNVSTYAEFLDRVGCTAPFCRSILLRHRTTAEQVSWVVMSTHTGRIQINPYQQQQQQSHANAAPGNGDTEQQQRGARDEEVVTVTYQTASTGACFMPDSMNSAPAGMVQCNKDGIVAHIEWHLPIRPVSLPVYGAVRSGHKLMVTPLEKRAVTAPVTFSGNSVWNETQTPFELRIDYRDIIGQQAVRFTRSNTNDGELYWIANGWEMGRVPTLTRVVDPAYGPEGCNEPVKPFLVGTHLPSWQECDNRNMNLQGIIDWRTWRWYSWLSTNEPYGSKCDAQYRNRMSLSTERGRYVPDWLQSDIGWSWVDFQGYRTSVCPRPHDNITDVLHQMCAPRSRIWFGSVESDAVEYGDTAYRFMPFPDYMTRYSNVKQVLQETITRLLAWTKTNVHVPSFLPSRLSQINVTFHHVDNISSYSAERIYQLYSIPQCPRTYTCELDGVEVSRCGERDFSSYSWWRGTQGWCMTGTYLRTPCADESRFGICAGNDEPRGVSLKEPHRVGSTDNYRTTCNATLLQTLLLSLKDTRGTPYTYNASDITAWFTTLFPRELICCGTSTSTGRYICNEGCLLDNGGGPGYLSLSAQRFFVDLVGLNTTDPQSPAAKIADRAMGNVAFFIPDQQQNATTTTTIQNNTYFQDKTWLIGTMVPRRDVLIYWVGSNTNVTFSHCRYDGLDAYYPDLSDPRVYINNASEVYFDYYLRSRIRYYVAQTTGVHVYVTQLAPSIILSPDASPDAYDAATDLRCECPTPVLENTEASHVNFTKELLSKGYIRNSCACRPPKPFMNFAVDRIELSAGDIFWQTQWSNTTKTGARASSDADSTTLLHKGEVPSNINLLVQGGPGLSQRIPRDSLNSTFIHQPHGIEWAFLPNDIFTTFQHTMQQVDDIIAKQWTRSSYSAPHSDSEPSMLHDDRVHHGIKFDYMEHNAHDWGHLRNPDDFPLLPRTLMPNVERNNTAAQLGEQLSASIPPGEAREGSQYFLSGQMPDHVYLGTKYSTSTTFYADVAIQLNGDVAGLGVDTAMAFFFPSDKHGCCCDTDSPTPCGALQIDVMIDPTQWSAAQRDAEAATNGIKAYDFTFELTCDPQRSSVASTKTSFALAYNASFVVELAERLGVELTPAAWLNLSSLPREFLDNVPFQRASIPLLFTDSATQGIPGMTYGLSCSLALYDAAHRKLQEELLQDNATSNPTGICDFYRSTSGQFCCQHGTRFRSVTAALHTRNKKTYTPTNSASTSTAVGDQCICDAGWSGKFCQYRDIAFSAIVNGPQFSLRQLKDAACGILDCAWLSSLTLSITSQGGSAFMWIMILSFLTLFAVLLIVSALMVLTAQTELRRMRHAVEQRKKDVALTALRPPRPPSSRRERPYRTSVRIVQPKHHNTQPT